MSKSYSLTTKINVSDIKYWNEGRRLLYFYTCFWDKNVDFPLKINVLRPTPIYIMFKVFFLGRWLRRKWREILTERIIFGAQMSLWNLVKKILISGTLSNPFPKDWIQLYVKNVNKGVLFLLFPHFWNNRGLSVCRSVVLVNFSFFLFFNGARMSRVPYFWKKQGFKQQ